MRSSTTFLIFAGLVVLLVIYGMISESQRSQNPPVKATIAFVAAVKANDAARVETLSDAKTTTMIAAGNKIISLQFGKIAPFPGAFVKKDAVTWSYGELSRLTLDPAVAPVMLENKETGEKAATLALQNNYKIYLHTVGREWKVFYVDKSEEKPQ
jgi:hypothetical protein